MVLPDESKFLSLKLAEIVKVSDRRRETESRAILVRTSSSVAKGASSTMRVLDYHLPLVIDRAEGAHIWDADGNELIDMNMGYGPLIFGHRSPILLDAIEQELRRRGTILGFPHRLSHEVAELIKDSFPSVDLLRFTSTGTEAGQTAIRLARAYTGRSHIILFEGHYHGSSADLFHRYHAPLAELEQQADNEAIPGTLGMNDAPRNAFVLPWNDTDLLARVVRNNSDKIAAIMMEPIMGNSGVIPPKPGFLRRVREIADQAGAVLIFDEVITGFRVARGGVQELSGVKADLTLFSKALAGGVPVGAIGGKQDILELMVNGDVFHGGVYSGNPMSLAATLATQQAYAVDGAAIYSQLNLVSGKLATGLRSLFAERKIPACVQHVGPMLSFWLLKEEGLDAPTHYREVCERSDASRFIRLQHIAQRNGLYFHPNHYEPWYISTSHTEELMDEVLTRMGKAVDKWLVDEENQI